jgi:hypothetical protein
MSEALVPSGGGAISTPPPPPQNTAVTGDHPALRDANRTPNDDRPKDYIPRKDGKPGLPPEELARLVKVTEEKRAEVEAERAKNTPPAELKGEALNNWYAARVAEKGERSKAPDELPRWLSKYGDRETITTTLKLVDGIYSDDSGKGATDALDAIFERDRSAFERIGFAITSAAPALAVRHLVELGYLPETIETPLARELPAELQSLIPDNLRSTAEEVPAVVLYDWVNMGILLSQLEQKQQLDRALGEARAQANEDLNRGIAEARQAGQKTLTEEHDRYVNLHYEQLNKWHPTGNREADSALRDMVFASGLNAMLADPKWANIQTAMAIMTIDAPLWRVLKGDHMTADIYERDARALAERFNARFGQIMKATIHALTPWLINQRQLDVEAKAKEAEKAEYLEPGEWTGMKPPPTLVNGKTNPAYIAWVSQNVKHKAVITQEQQHASTT